VIGPRTGLLAIAGVSLAAVAAALVTQHVFNMQPCPWCVLQRLIFVVMAALALLGALLPGALRKLALVGVTGVALCGVAAALWQHFVAASSQSCNLTLADRIVSALRLDEWLPQVFMAMATCADAKVDLWGLPYEAWSLGLFGILGLFAFRLLRQRTPGLHLR
jgi:protein dithiol:quinone oxidoreductase